MDIIQDWASYVLGDHATPAMHFLVPYTRQISSTLQTIRAIVEPLINQLLNKPDLTTVALLVIILFVSLKILDMLWQTILFWVRLVTRLAFWGSLALLGVWLYSRGADGVMNDLQYWFDVWKKDYDYWVEQERVARLVHEGGGAMPNRFRNQGNGRAWF